MKERMVGCLKSLRGSKITLGIMLVVALMLISIVIPVLAAGLSYLDVEGTYTVTSLARPRYTDGATHCTVKFGELIITTQTGKAITDATLEHMGADIALAGIVGPGSRPALVLYGTDSDGTQVQIQAKVLSKSGEVTRINGRIVGLVTSDGERFTGSIDGTSAIDATEYYSEPLSCKLVGGTDANPEALLFHRPVTGLTLKKLTTLAAGQLGFYFNLEDGTGPGPQMMLRFAPRGSTTQSYYGGGTSGLVDIMVMPYQAPYTGDGTWTKCEITKDSGAVIYYGNDPTDYTSFGGTPVATLADVEAAINAEVAMTAGGDSASDWVLTMVDVELWEGGDRDCYIDNVTIGRQLYTLEPNSYTASFRAIPAD